MFGNITPTPTDDKHILNDIFSKIDNQYPFVLQQIAVQKLNWRLTDDEYLRIVELMKDTEFFICKDVFTSHKTQFELKPPILSKLKRFGSYLSLINNIGLGSMAATLNRILHTMNDNRKPYEPYNYTDLSNDTGFGHDIIIGATNTLKKDGLVSASALEMSLMPAGKLFISSGGYTGDTLAMHVEQVQHKGDVFTQTMYGDGGTMSGRDTTQTPTQPSEVKKVKWYKKIWDEFVKNIVQYGVTAAITFLSGLGIGKSCNQPHNPKDIPEATQKTGQVKVP